MNTVKDMLEKMKSHPEIVKKSLGDPTLIQYPFVWYVCDRDPTASEPDVLILDFPDWLFPWWNTTTNDIFFCIDNTTDAMVWSKIYTETNLALPLSLANGGTGSVDSSSARTALGLNINSTRAYANVSSPAFSAPRTPGALNDTFVSGSVKIQNGLLDSTSIDIQIDNGGLGTFSTIATLTDAMVESNLTFPVSFIVPLGCQYQLVASGTGTPAILNLSELTL